MRTEPQHSAVRERHACARSHAHSPASAATSLRMADSASPARRSARASHQPLSLAEEQAALPCPLMRYRAAGVLPPRWCAGRCRMHLGNLGFSGDLASFRHLQRMEERSVRTAACMMIGHQPVLHDEHHSPHVALGVPVHDASTLTRCSPHCLLCPLSCRDSDRWSHPELLA